VQIPEMNRTMDHKMQRSWRAALVILGLQIIGILIGLIVIFVMCLYGSMIERMF
jgi:hypothetical protein